MKYIDINQKFTAKVAEYIAKGYTINTATMSGSQGEVAHVDLTDGKQVVRVLLDSFTEYDSFNSLSGLEIVVGTPADKVVPYDTVRYNTIWNNRLEVIESERFYEIGSSKRRGNIMSAVMAATSSLRCIWPDSSSACALAIFAFDSFSVASALRFALSSFLSSSVMASRPRKRIYACTAAPSSNLPRSTVSNMPSWASCCTRLALIPSTAASSVVATFLSATFSLAAISKSTPFRVYKVDKIRQNRITNRSEIPKNHPTN